MGKSYRRIPDLSEDELLEKRDNTRYHLYKKLNETERYVENFTGENFYSDPEFNSLDGNLTREYELARLLNRFLPDNERIDLSEAEIRRERLYEEVKRRDEDSFREESRKKLERMVEELQPQNEEYILDSFDSQERYY